MLQALQIPAAVADAILTHAGRDVPYEACGLLVGHGTAVVRLAPATNADASTTRYSVPSDQHFAAIRAARHDGLDVIGAYHSHPLGAAVPSATDTAEAFSDFVFLIAGLSPEPHLRAWHLVDGNFAELRVVRT